MSLLTILLILVSHHLALADPILGPDISNCRANNLGSGIMDCCVPTSPNITDFHPPPPNATARIRRPAHLLDSDYIDKYANATALMKQLGPTHPWNFMQQSRVHCAYCDGFYNQTGYGVEFQIHGNWLFYPYHRAYLYFYERILGKLIDDETFALPFWNWDHPDGMPIPSAYTDPASPLYDPSRNPYHQPPNITDLNDNDEVLSRKKRVARNLNTMHRQMVRGGKAAELFMGGAYRAGKEQLGGGGTLEYGAHGAIHDWAGGNLSRLTTSGADPLFFAHHANVDRMWELWRGLPGGNRSDFSDADWLDTGFLFWDENMQLVRIRVRDVLHVERLGYSYQNQTIPWLNATHTPVPTKKLTLTTGRKVVYPITLDSTVRVEVARPGGLRKDAGTEEVLVMDEIGVEMGADCKFDVYVNAGADDELEASQFAGSFRYMAMRTWQSDRRVARTTRRLVLGLTDLLEDIGASGNESIFVILVPRTKSGKVTVGSIKINDREMKENDLRWLESWNKRSIIYQMKSRRKIRKFNLNSLLSSWLTICNIFSP